VGTWGLDPFDNDGAMDILGDLADASAMERLAAVTSAVEAAQLPVDEWSDQTQTDEVLAAVAMVAANVPGGQSLTVHCEGRQDLFLP
jgi:hypothetical protein